MERHDSGNELGRRAVRGIAAALLLIGSTAMISQTWAADASASEPVVRPLPLPTGSRSAASVGARLFHRRLVVRDGQKLGDVIRTIVADTGLKPDAAVLHAAGIGEPPVVWDAQRADELVILDPLTVSVVNLPAAVGTGALLLVGLWAVRTTRHRWGVRLRSRDPLGRSD